MCQWLLLWTQIARLMGPTWGPPGSCRPQVGPCKPHEPCYQWIVYPGGRLVLVANKSLLILEYVLFRRQQVDFPRSDMSDSRSTRYRPRDLLRPTHSPAGHVRSFINTHTRHIATGRNYYPPINTLFWMVQKLFMMLMLYIKLLKYHWFPLRLMI